MKNLSNDTDELMQPRHNPITLAMELQLVWVNALPKALLIEKLMKLAISEMVKNYTQI